MTDKVLCPWCGREMEIKVRWHWDGVQPKDFVSGKRVWNAWSECTNSDCNAEGPYVYKEDSSNKAFDIAYDKALRRYEPPCRPLTWKDVESKYTGIDEGAAVLVEEKFGALWWAILDRLNKKIVATWNSCGAENFREDDYGKTWRCWPRKPTKEEREACGWEDAE